MYNPEELKFTRHMRMERNMAKVWEIKKKKKKIHNPEPVRWLRGLGEAVLQGSSSRRVWHRADAQRHLPFPVRPMEGERKTLA